MSIDLTREAYQKLVNEDIEWLLKQPRTLEREHIEAIVSHSVSLLYDKIESLKEEVNALRDKLSQNQISQNRRR
jgi:hypothetical protein